ncbi:hypothetical protein EVB32_335 [Rhizobium phage RHph_TM39]|nr:hypothetical protein EVB32_335 [Rhizobium phage RHph_TM39]
MHRLSRDFTLDMSKLSRPYGSTSTSTSNTINLLLCNTFDSDLIYDYSEIKIETIRGHQISSDLVYDRFRPNLLDVNLILDRFVREDYYMFQTTTGRITSHDLVIDDSFAFDIRRRRHNIYAFTLDESKLDQDLRPLDGNINYSWQDKSLSHNFVLGKSMLDRAETLRTNHIAMYRHGISADVDAITTPTLAGDQSSGGTLNFGKKFNSIYLTVL